MGRRVRGLSLGFLILAVNILIVGALIVATSAGGISKIFDGQNGSENSGTSTGEDTTAQLPGGDADPEVDLRSRFAAGDPVNVVVLGDQTGTGEESWVRTWAQDLATHRPVELLATAENDPTTYGDPESLADPDSVSGGLITVRNASVNGGTPSDVLERVNQLVPDDTDVVILNFGRSNNWVDIGRGLDGLLETLVSDVPRAQVRVVVQPPRQDSQASIERDVRQWARAHGVEMLDVAEVFVDQDLLTETTSAEDPLNVNARGAEVWARVVQEELFGTKEADGTEGSAG